MDMPEPPDFDDGDPGPGSEPPPKKRRKRGEDRGNLHVLPPIEWKDRLQMTAQGGYKANLYNACVALRHAPELQGAVAFDLFGLQTMVMQPLPWDASIRRPWSPIDDLRFAEWLQGQGPNIGVVIVQQAVECVAHEREFHPVRDWLEELVWDRQPRVENWLTYYLGVEPSPYVKAVGKAWLVSAVARIFRPGCKADYMLILEGPQGKRKSEALKVLFGMQWFTDELADIGSKDAAMQMRGRWVIEWAELDQMGRAEVGRIKAFCTRQVDRFRPPYGLRVIACPRECVFAGTVNDDEYLKDSTGNRRYWPVLVGVSLDIEALADAREQLWAEAVHLYREGEPWWLSGKLEAMARTEQALRQESDGWEEAILEWANRQMHDGFTTTDVLRQAINLPLEKISDRDNKRVAKILRTAGWTRKSVKLLGSPIKGWKKNPA